MSVYSIYAGASLEDARRQNSAGKWWLDPISPFSVQWSSLVPGSSFDYL